MDSKTKNDLLGIIRALSLLPCARPFLKPVDVVALNIPDYLEIVQKPMDIGTIKKKLVNKNYASVEEYIEDVYQIFDNCRRYNTDPRNPFRLMCEDLQTQFEYQWKMYQDRKKGENEKTKADDEKLPMKREIENIDFKKNRRVKIKDDEKDEEYEKEREREKERKREKALEKERALEKEKKEIEIEPPKPKKETKKRVEIEYEETLNFDKLTGKEDFQSVIKLKVPEIPVIPEEAPAEESAAPVKLESIEYMKAALLPLVDNASKQFLRNTLLNAIYTVSHL